MSAKHIALVSSRLDRGGAERVLTEMAGHFASVGRRVSLLTLDGSCVDAYPLHVSINRVRLNILWPSPHVWARVVSTHQRQAMIRRTILELKVDVVISFIDYTNVRVIAAIVGSGVPVIVSERTDPTRHSVHWFWAMARRLAYPFAAAVVVQTESVARWARQWLRHSSVVVIPNSVRKVGSTQPEPMPLNMPRGPVIIAMGRLSLEKGFDILIRSFAAIEKDCKEWQLVVIGDGPMRRELEELANSLGVANRVSLPGNQENPAAWLKHASIFVLPSRFEGFPNALLEAMQCGLPVVAFDCRSGPSEIIRDGVDGLLVPPEDSLALAGAMARLVHAPVLRNQLARHALEVADRFPPEKIYGMWLNLCDKLSQ